MSRYKIKKVNSKKDIINLLKLDLWDNNLLLKTKLKSTRLFKKLYGDPDRPDHTHNVMQNQINKMLKTYLVSGSKVIDRTKIFSYYSNLFFKLYRLYKFKHKNLTFKSFLFNKKHAYNLKQLKFFFNTKPVQKKRKKTRKVLKLLTFKLNKILSLYPDDKTNQSTRKIVINISKKFKTVLKKKFNSPTNLRSVFKKKLNYRVAKQAKAIKAAARSRRARHRKPLPLYFDYVQKKYITVKEYFSFKNLKLNRYNNDFLHTYFSKHYVDRRTKYPKKNKFSHNYDNRTNNPINNNYMKNVSFKFSILNVRKIYKFKKRIILNNFAKAIIQKQHFKKYFFNISTKKLKMFYKKINKSFKHKINKLNNSFLYNLEYTIFFFILRSKLIKDHFSLKLFIEAGNIFVNKKQIFDQFYRLKLGDVVTFKDEAVCKNLRLNFFEYRVSKIRRPLSHIMVSYSILKLIFIKKPKLNELKYTFKINNSFLNYLNRNRLN